MSDVGPRPATSGAGGAACCADDASVAGSGGSGSVLPVPDAGADTTLDGAAGSIGTDASDGAPAPALMLVEPVVLLQTPLGFVDSMPELVLASVDGHRIALVLRRQAAAGNSAPHQIRHMGLEPWSNWPPSGAALQSHLTLTDAALSGHHAVGPAPGDHFSVRASKSGSSWLARSVSPDADYVGTLSEIAGEARFVSLGPSAQLVGTQGSSSASARLTLFPTTGPSQAVEIGCGPGGTSTRAVAAGTEWLVATPGYHVAVPGGCTTEATPHVGFFRVSAAPMLLAEVPKYLSILLSAPPHFEMAPHPEGQWVVFSGGGYPRIHRRIPPSSGLDCQSLVQPGSWQGELDADAVGGRAVAVVWTDLGAKLPRVNIDLTDEWCIPLGSKSLERPVTGKPSVVSSPSGTGLLVAWAEDGPNPGIALARFDYHPTQSP